MNESATSDNNKAIGQRTILLVEDDVLVRESVGHFLRDHGYRVVEAANASEAVLALTSRTPIDLVFSDCDLPNSMGGVALSRWLQQHHPHIPVVLTSGMQIPHDDLQSVTFVPKPYAVAEVITLFEALLQKTNDRSTPLS